MRALDYRGERHRAEVILATIRASLVSALFVVRAFDLGEYISASSLESRVLVWYLAYSFGLLLLMRYRRAHSFGVLCAIQILDVLWPTLAGVLTSGPRNLFLIFYVFVLFAAAYRWGMRGTLAAVAMLITALYTQLAVCRVMLVPLRGREGSQVWLEAGYLFFVGVLAGYLGEEQKHSRAESASIARLLSSIQGNDGLKKTINRLLSQVMCDYGCRRALLLSGDKLHRRVFLCDSHRDESKCHSSWRELLGDEKKSLLFEVADGVCRAKRVSNNRFKITVLRDDGSIHEGKVTWPLPFVRAYSTELALIASVRLNDQFFGRLLLLNCEKGRYGHAMLSFLGRVVQEVSPAIQNLYLHRTLQHHASSIERARIGRDLHDGVMQALFATELRLHSLHGRVSTQEKVSTELREIQTLIHDQLLSLREMVEGTRAVEITPDELLAFINDTVKRFGEHTNINAHFACDVPQVDMSTSQCREVARILGEALTNVRRHSGARTVMVRLFADIHCWHLTVEDDGRGFDFVGVRSLRELERSRLGPSVIKERVRSMRGELTIESHPYTGSRLEVIIPRHDRARNAAHAA